MNWIEISNNIICEMPCVKSSCMMLMYFSGERKCDGNNFTLHFATSVKDLDGALDDLVTRGLPYGGGQKSHPHYD